MKNRTAADRNLQLFVATETSSVVAGYEAISWDDLVSRFIAPSEGAGVQRSDLDNAAQSLLTWLEQTRRIAVTGVPAQLPGDLRRLYGYVLEPCFRRDLDLVIHTQSDLHEALRIKAAGTGLSWTELRIQYLIDLYERRAETERLPPMTPIEVNLHRAMLMTGLAPEAQFRVGNFVLDFAIPHLGLAIEADGRGWHDAVRDKRRDEHLKAYGWRTLRFTGSQIYWDADGCALEVALVAAEREHSASPVTPPSRLVGPSHRSWRRRFLDFFRGRQAPSAPAVDEADDPVELAATESSLDADQRSAVRAAEGVVQVLAPAGSGKTATIVARVTELLGRGVPRNRILVTTFNRAAAIELGQRLASVGAGDVEVRNFHSLGRHILKEQNVLRANIGTPTYGQLRRISSAVARREGTEFIDAPELLEAISDYKLFHGLSPEGARARAKSVLEISAAEAYAIYESDQTAAERHDFDDLIFETVKLLRSDADARSVWQRRWQCILVDEFQDIEPAQLQLIQMLAAPEDSLYAVGDEDQCIYTWRRADIRRIVNFDQTYPGLERFVLQTTYRCPPAVANAARRLIEHNTQRFPKVIEPVSGAPEGEARYQLVDNYASGAAAVVALLKQVEDPKDIVVIARSSRLLTEVVGVAINANIAVSAPARALRLTDSEEVVSAYLRLALYPERATPADISLVCRRPNSYLPDDGAKQIVTALAAGESFESVVATLFASSDEWRREALIRWAQLCDQLRTTTSWPAFLDLVRGGGGLDRYYSSAEKMSRIDMVDLDALDGLAASHATSPLSEVLNSIEQKQRLLSRVENDDRPTVEFTTIHGAKGREWKTVIIFGAEDDQLPHHRAIEDAGGEPSAIASAIEDERRLAYVAMTRASERLVVVALEGIPSRFIFEAGLSRTTPQDDETQDDEHAG